MRIRKGAVLVLVVGLLLCLAAIAQASNTASQTVTFQVTALNEITVTGNPQPLIINTATAGSGPVSVQDASTKYSITTNEESKKIAAALDTAMPTGTTLKVKLASSKGSSAGDVTLDTTAANVVTGLSKCDDSDQTITYTFGATSAAGVIDSQTRTVTFTLTDAGGE